MKGSLPICVLLCSAAVSFAWDLKPDPPAEKPWTVQPGLAIPVSRFDHIVFAAANGPFVLTGIGDNHTRQVYDLRTGTSVGKLNVEQGKPRSGDEHLSPDGQVWAFGHSYGQSVKLYSVVTGKLLPAVKTNDGIMEVGFAPDNRLLVVTSADEKHTVRLFDTATGKEALNWLIDVDKPLRPTIPTHWFAFSPGGKYLAVTGAKAVTVYVTADGKKLAELELPVVESEYQPRVGMAFSADGGELAAVVGKSAKGTCTLKVWKLADGTSAEHTLNRPSIVPGTFIPVLAPILSGGWVIDGTELWADGKVRSVPQSPVATLTRLALTPTQQVMVIEPPILERGKKPTTLGVLGRAGIATSVAKDGTLAGAVEVSIDERAGWTGPLAAYAPPAAPPPHKLTLPKPAVGLTVSLDGRRCFLECDYAKAANLARRAVLSIDAQTGANVSFDLSLNRVVYGDTLTGDVFLTLAAPDTVGNGERLELTSADGQSAIAWRPHPEMKPAPSRSSIRYAAALSATRVITVGNGRATLWQLPEAKAVWTAKMSEAAGGGLSPDGKVLFVNHPRGVRALNVETGGTLGNLAAEGDGWRAMGDRAGRVRVSGDGTKLAALDATAVRVWDLTTGRQIAIMGAAGIDLNADSGPTVHWLGSRFLLFGNSVRDTADGGRVAWSLEPLPEGAIANSGPAGGRVWFAPGTAGPPDLHAAAFPEEQLARFLAHYDASGENGLFKKGEKVKVVIKDPAEAPPGWEAQARTSARVALTQDGLIEDATATTVVTVTYTIVRGETIRMKWQGAENSGQEETFRKFGVESRTEVTRDGEVVFGTLPTTTTMRMKAWPLLNQIDDDSKSG